MKTKFPSPTPSRKDRLIHEHVHDPYKTTHKLPEPSVCPVCNAVFMDGRWQWAESWPFDAHKEICQACHRTKDGYPAGVVTLTGAFTQAHKAEILNLARHHEKQENTEHPLHRIMKIEEHPDAIVIKTTDIHLPQRIGEALRHAYKGELDMHYDEEGYLVRINWNREK
jgi:NMD protein affecting ribosome stability and mRNA decay